MTLAQFMLPGESVSYESPGEVYHRRKPHALVITGERLLLHAVTGLFGPKERVVAEPLSGLRHLEYSEQGLLSKRGRLDVRFADHTLSLTGEPDVLKDVWQALQRHTLKGPVGAPDEELTLVAPPPPLFDDIPQPPAQVEPLAAAAPYPRPAAPRRSGALVLGAVCLIAVAATAAVILSIMRRPSAPPSASRQTPAVSPTPATPTPSPTPVLVRVMDESFTLEDGSHRAVKFNVPAGEAEARVSGGFRVTSGGYIDFYLMSETQYARFAAGAPPDVTSVVYREEQWNARIGERLPPGSYYLVFDNRDDDTQTVAAEFFVVSG